MGTYVMIIQLKKELLNLKATNLIDSVTGLFKMVQYDDKHDIYIADLIDTKWLAIYPRPT